MFTSIIKLHLQKEGILRIANSTSLHSDRDYEVGIVYMDDYNRATTALVSENNSIHVPCSNSITQNILQE